MYFHFSFLPATVLVGVGYFVLFSSTKTQGVVQALGRALAIWIFALSAALPVAGAYATYTGVPPLGEMMRSMHS